MNRWLPDYRANSPHHTEKKEMELFYIGFIDWFRDNPYLMYISTATVKERKKTYKVEAWTTEYPTFKLDNDTFFNSEKLQVLKETKKPNQTIYKKADLNSVIEVESGYLGTDRKAILEKIKTDVESKALLSISDDYILEQIEHELERQ